MTGYGSVELIRERASQRRPTDTERVLGTLTRHHPWTFRTIPDPESLVREFSRFPVTVNFHPDRIALDGHTAAGSLLSSGIYRTQFETGLSAGSYSSHDGGDRARWERELFGVAAIDARHRPRYGALNVAGHPDGGSPRFGSCFLELNPKTLQRCTFTSGSSHLMPSDIGTFDEAMAVLAGLLETADATGEAFRLESGSVGGVVELLSSPRSTLRPTTPGRALDSFLEVQIHGPIHLDSDVTALVLDPSFRGSEIGDQLTAAAAAHGVRVRWHRGFRLDAAEVNSDFRGPGTVSLAEQVQQTYGGPLTAESIGRAHRARVGAPIGLAGTRSSIDQDREALDQQFKYLWHTLVEFGKPWR